MNPNSAKSNLLNSLEFCALLIAVEWLAFKTAPSNTVKSFNYFLIFSLAYSLIGFSGVWVMVRRDLVSRLSAYYMMLIVLFVSAFNFIFLNAMSFV